MQADHDQEGARDGSADGAADLLEAGNLRVDRLRRDGEAGSEGEDDGGVTEREEEADPHRSLAVLQQLPRRVVDRRDVIGVERVAETEGVGERTEPGECRIAASEVEEQPPTEHMQEDDSAREPSEARPFGAGQRLATPAPPTTRLRRHRRPSANPCFRHPHLLRSPSLTRLVRAEQQRGSLETTYGCRRRREAATGRSSAPRRTATLSWGCRL